MDTTNKAIVKSAAFGVFCGLAGMAVAWRMLSSTPSSGGGDAAAGCPMSGGGGAGSKSGGGGSGCPFAFMMGGSKNKGVGGTCPMSGGSSVAGIDLDAAIINAGGEVGCTCKSYSYEELSACTGADDGDVCMAVKGVVYRLTRQFYGPGEPYSAYAGKDITIPLAISEVSDVLSNVTHWESFIQKSSDGDAVVASGGEGVKPPSAAFDGSGTAVAHDDKTKNLSGPANLTREERLRTLQITAEELRILGLWETKFRRKYRVVGWVKEMQKGDDAGGVHTFSDYLDMERFVRNQAGQEQ